MKSKRLTKIIALTLALTAFAQLTPTISQSTAGKLGFIESAYAGTDVVVDGIKYTVYEDYAETKAGTYSEAGNSGLTGNITIQSEIQGKPVTRIGAYSFYKTSVTSVTIPNSVTDIDKSAFGGCSSMTSIKLSNSLETLGDSSLSSCSSLTNVDLPDSLKVIGKTAFYSCTSLVTPILPNGLEIIGDGVWQCCTSITGNIVLPDSVIDIGEQPFRESNLESIEAPKFLENEMLYHSVEYTGSSTAGSDADCMFRDSEDIVGDLIFAEYKNGYAVSLLKDTSDTSPLVVPDTYKGKKVIYIPCCGFRAFKGSSIELPDGIEEIKPFTFAYTARMGEIKLPSNLKSIGKCAFDSSKSLTKVVIPDSVTFIDETAFNKCTSLETVKLPKSLEMISNRTFEGCTNLKNINIPESVTKIDYSAFYGCSSLESISIPESVTKINSAVFKNCTNLRTVEIAGDTDTYDNAFENCTSLEVFKLPTDTVSGSRPDYLPSGTYHKVYLYDKSDDILSSYLVKSGTDFRPYALSVGTSWAKVSGTGLYSNVSSDLEYQLTGELIGSGSVDTPLLSSQSTAENRASVVLTIQ